MIKYFKILGLPKGASKAEIKKSYRELALKFHPDKNPDKDATERFIEITEAYEMLTNNRKPKNRIFERNSEEVAREKAKQYAKMHYEEFKRKADAFNMPMHKILWTLWINFIILAFCAFIIIDFFADKKEVNGIAKLNPDGSYSVCNTDFYLDESESNTDINQKHITLKLTPYLFFTDSLICEGKKHKTKSRLLEITPLIVIITILTLITIFGKTKKLENKLLIKGFTAMLLFIYLILFFTRNL